MKVLGNILVCFVIAGGTYFILWMMLDMFLAQ